MNYLAGKHKVDTVGRGCCGAAEARRREREGKKVGEKKRGAVRGRKTNGREGPPQKKTVAGVGI